MNSVETKQNGKIETWVLAIIIIVVIMVTNFFKELFVEQGGNIQIFGNFGLLLIAGLIWKWKHIRKVVSILTLLAIIGILMGVIMSKSLTIPFLVLLVGMIISFYLSTFSNGVKTYLDKE